MTRLSGAALLGNSRKAMLGIARMTYGAREHPAVGTWLARTCMSFVRHKSYRGMTEFYVNRQPVYAARNFAIEVAISHGADLLCMVDADQVPDPDPTLPTFFERALTLMLDTGPCVIVAPTPMTNGKVNIHKNDNNDLVLMDLEEVKDRKGAEIVPAAGLGLALIDLRVLTHLHTPYFRFEYTTDSCYEILSGEDVSFTARLTQAGIPVYALWDTWSGHSKETILKRP